MRFRAIAVVMVGALIGGCQMGAQQAEADTAGQPPAYKLGYSHGCDSGNAAAGSILMGKNVKDVQKYASDSLYKQGYDDGFAKCKGQTDSIQRSYDSRARW